jgi:hypothetical protein
MKTLIQSFTSFTKVNLKFEFTYNEFDIQIFVSLKSLSKFMNILFKTYALIV